VKRSGDVTASAIVLFCGNVFYVLIGSLAILGAKASGEPVDDVYVGVLLLCIAPAVWGIATGVGVLKLRRWAWVSIIVISGVTIFFSFFFAVALMFMPSLLGDQPDLSAANVRTVVDIGLPTLLLAMAIAIWWLVLFTRDRVRMQFAKRGAASISATAGESASESDLSRGLTSLPAGGQIPTSIRVIAIMSMAGAAIVLFSLQFVVRRHHPLVMFGMLVSGWWVLLYGTTLVTAQTVLPIYTLRRRAWALEGMIWYGVVNLANACLFLISPARNRYFEVLKRDVVPPGVNAETLDHLRRTVAYTSFSFAICVGVVCLYFLFTRRKAFRAACEARRAAA